MTRRARYSILGWALIGAALALPAAMQAQTVTRTLSFTPSSFNFGNLPLGTSSPSQTFTVKNTGNATVTFTELMGGTNYFHVTDTCISAGSLTPGSTCTFSVVFSPDVAGPLNGTVTYFDNATGSPQSVPLSGGGIGSKSINFPPPTTPVLPGSSATLQATTNVGDPVTFSITGGTGAATLSGTNNSTITYTQLGTVVIQADSAASTYYAAAPSLAQTVTVAPATITSVTPSSITSNANGATLTLAGQNLPTTFGAGGYGYCFYTGYGSTAPITPTSTNPTVIAVPASTISSIPSTAFSNGVFNASLYVIKQPFSAGVAVNCGGTADATLSNTVSYPIAQVPTLGSFDVASIPATNAATATQPPPYALIFTGTGFGTGTTIVYTWTGGTGAGTVKYASGSTLVATVPATVPSTVTSIQATACNQTSACSTPLTINLSALNSVVATLAATPNPATVQQPVMLTSTFAPGPNTLVSAGAPSGTVTFANGGTTLGTAKLVLDTAATLQSPTSTLVSAPPATRLTTADVNGDGIPDVVYVDNKVPALLHVDLGSIPFGTFQSDLIGELPAGCSTFNSMALGDLNGDGFADLIVDCSNSTGVVSVYSLLSHGDGTFAPANQVTPVFGTQVALKDMNKDGKLDLVVAGAAQSSACVSNCSGFVLFTGNGDGTFTYSVLTSIAGMASSNLLLTDIDGDGYPDIVELNNLSMGTQSIDIYLSNKATSFGTIGSTPTTPSYSIPLGSYPANLYNYLFTGDFNGDGLPDLGTVLNPATNSNLMAMLNTSSPGAVSFAAPVTSVSGGPITDVATGDLNGDGRSDLLITGNNSAVFVESLGTGVFSTVYPGLTIPTGTVFDMQAADVNADGYADAVVISTLSGSYFVRSYVVSGKANASLNTSFSQSGTFPLTTTWPGNINFSGAVGNLSLTVNAASSTTSLRSSGTPSVYGQPVTFTAAVSSTAATGTPTGTITFLDGSVPLGLPVTMSGGSASYTLSTLTAGTHSITASYSGDPVFSAGGSGTVSQGVNQALPVITWNPSPTNITYGTTLVAGQLNATAATPYFPAVAGTFNYTPAVGALLGAGTQALNVTFTPTDTLDFKTATGTANISVAKFAPTVNWTPPAAIIAGTPLSATQLNATATGIPGVPALPGIFTYTPPSGTVLTAGANQALSVLFTPTDITDYATATGNTTITVIPLAIATVAPTSVTLGAAATPITLTGTGFLPNSVVNVNGTPLATYAYVNATTMTATLPASLLSTPQTLNITVFDPTQNQTSAAGTFTVIAPPVVASLSGPTTAQPAQQPTLNFALTTPYPVALTGTLTLTFAGTGGANDPAIQFASGGRTLVFTVPANSTTTPTIQLQAGTDAGAITVTLVLTAGGQNVTPANIVPLLITVPPAPPTITSMTLTRSGNSITANIIGYSNTRDMASAQFTFTAANGQSITNPSITVPATALFATWFGNATSQTYGSNFLYTQTFNLSADQSTIGSIAVTLTNSAGASASATAQ